MPAITVYLDVVQRFDLNPSLILSNCSRALARGRMRAVGVRPGLEPGSARPRPARWPVLRAGVSRIAALIVVRFWLHLLRIQKVEKNKVSSCSA